MKNNGRAIGSIIFICLIGVWLSACQQTETAEEPVASEPICEEAGIVEKKVLEETTRGYPYRYWVYLPPCYDADLEKMYPVLYLLPGRNSSPGAWFSAGVNEVADEMILSGQIPPFLIVTTEEISSDPLAEMIYAELLPQIESSYRVKTERQQRAVAGGSLGSVGAYRLAFQHPNQFASAGMFGSGLIHGEEERVQAWLDAMTTEEQPRVFLNCGEQDPLMMERAEAMVDVLDEMQMEHIEIFSPGEHTYAYWVSNFPAYLEWLAQDWTQEAG